MNAYREITVRTEKGLFRLFYQHYYSSTSVERFRLRAKDGQRTMELEKRLDLKSNQWKITAGVITTKDPNQAAKALTAITRQLEYNLSVYYKTRAIDEFLNDPGGHVVYFNNE